MAHPLGPNVHMTLIQNPIVAATTNVRSSALDMANYEGCMFVYTLGAGTTSMAVAVQAAAATSGAWAAISGAANSVVGADDNKGAAIDVYHPHSKGRYLSVLLTPSTAAGVWDFGGINAIRYGGRLKDQTSTGLVDGGIVNVSVQTT